MRFDEVADELFAARREDFTELRDERAKQARPDRSLARRIGALRKPTVAAWLVNQVSRGFPEEIGELAELGAALRRAHEQLSGADLRRLSRERHEMIEKLGKRARWLARKEGYPVSDATARQVEDTFEAAIADEQALAAVRAAQLSAALTPGSPEQWLTAAVLPEPGSKAGPVAAKPREKAAKGGGETDAKPRRGAKRDGTEPKPGRATGTKATREGRAKATRGAGAKDDRGGRAKDDREAKARARREAEEAKARKEAERARTKARREAEEAAEAQAEAERSLAEAEEAAEEAAETVADLRARLTEATQAERARRAAVSTARKALTAAKRKAAVAEKHATEVE